jgi:putative membrane protein
MTHAGLLVTAPAGSLAWHPHWDAWLATGLVAGAYAYALGRWGPVGSPGRPAASRRHKLYFFAGVAALWIASDWPIHGYDTVLFSVHMVQHLLLAFVTAPLLILGTPAWLLRRLLAPKPIQRTFKAATRPLVALAIFNGWVLAYHWPVLVDLSVRSHGAHFVMHVMWVVTALIVWWPVLSPLPELPHMSYLARLGYIFGLTVLPSIPASFLTFADVSFYATYAAAPRVTELSVIADQQLAGLIMKIGGGVILWTVFAVLFFLWAREEETGAPDPLYWRELEPDLRKQMAGTAVGGTQEDHP